MMATMIRLPIEKYEGALSSKGHVRQKSIFTHKAADARQHVLDVNRAECAQRGYRMLGKTLGEGAYAKVKLAEISAVKAARVPSMANYFPDGNFQVAIKVIHKKIVPKDFLNKFLPRELQNHLTIKDHPNVVHIFETFETPEYTYLTMEYMTNGDLLDLINQKISNTEKGLGEELSKRFFGQICSGLQHIHNHNIVHRDLKCENILISGKMNVKITDFGFSRLFQNKNIMLQTSCGSYAYTCPEVIKNKPYDGYKADIWSIGVILCAMVNGRLPYNDTQLLEMDEDMRMQRLRFERNVTFDCIVIVRKLLQYNPILRPELKDILADIWLTGKKPAIRQFNRSNWSNVISASKANVLSSGQGLRIEGLSPKKAPASSPPTTPLCYRNISPDILKNETVIAKGAVVLDKNSRETVILKSRRQVNVKQGFPQRQRKRPIWSKSVKEQTTKRRDEEMVTNNKDKKNDATLQKLVDASKERERARNANSERTNPPKQDNYTPWIYMYKFLQSNGTVRASPQRTVDVIVPPASSPSPPLSSTKIFTSPVNEVSSTLCSSPIYPISIDSYIKDKSIANDSLEDSKGTGDKLNVEVHKPEMKVRISPEIRCRSVPAGNKMQHSKVDKQTAAERARSCRNRVIHAYNPRLHKNNKSEKKAKPLFQFLVQKIDLASTEGTNAVESNFLSMRSSQNKKRTVKPVYTYKYH